MRYFMSTRRWAIVCLWLILSIAVSAEMVQAEGMPTRSRQEINQILATLQQEGQVNGHTFTVGYNPAMEYSIEQLCGLVEPNGWRRNARFAQALVNTAVLPSSFDWRSQNMVTPVKNQGGCGSCWAFSTVAPLESKIKMATGNDVIISEQYLVSCNKEGWNCEIGGWFAHDYHLAPGEPDAVAVTGEPESGAVLWSDFPYAGYDESCSPPHSHPYKLASWTYISSQYGIPSVQAIKQAIYNHGPVSVALCVGLHFQGYTGGIFNYDESASCNGGVNHAVALVGWNDDRGPDDGYWILKNSWGSTGWGNQGYMYIRYGMSQVGYAANYVELLNIIPPVTLAGLTIQGSGSVNVGATSTYTATASYSNTSSKGVNATFSLTATSAATITSGGVLTAGAVTSSQIVTVNASYSEGGVTKTAAMNVTISLPVSQLYVGFGAAYGLWKWDGTKWTQLTPVNPENMVTSGSVVYGDFGSLGLYKWDGGTWSQLTPANPENIVTAGPVLYGDFGSLGLWKYNGAWTQITPANPNMMADNGNNLVANFPAYGLYQYDGTTWTLLTLNSSVENMLGISGKVYADYGLLGLWKYDGAWTQITPANPDKMQTYNRKLVANFPGYGLYLYDGTTWAQLTPNDSVQDLIGVSSNLYADYGTLGLWKYNGTWTQITPADSNRLGYYGEKLVGNFPGYGLYEYNGSSWALLTPNSGATATLGVNPP